MTSRCESFYTTWIAYFDVPTTIAIDQATLLIPSYFKIITRKANTHHCVPFSKQCGERNEIPPSNKSSNHLPRQMKNKQILPNILLGPPAGLKETLNSTSAELEYVKCMPGEFFIAT
ncbi:hypothetical protein TNCT_630811 [Trichonephila clavata]|uniref:Uncharacterized protein n=1 Tax=Trichonephila clavata TaxID=2740835 RepID=A0A8X6FWC5_TRICU|nr:hypothetical protein TNCT_630811 [Trichonephila clavata]